MRSEEERKAEVEKLKAVKQHVPARTYFGDDNHGGIEAQIEVIEKALTMRRIESLYDEAGDGESTYYNHARDAFDWLNEEAESEAPSIGWEQLAKARAK